MNVEDVSDEVIDQVFKGLDESTLSEWEQGFVKSAKEWWIKRRRLSDKQKNKLVALWRGQNDPKSR